MSVTAVCPRPGRASVSGSGTPAVEGTVNIRPVVVRAIVEACSLGGCRSWPSWLRLEQVSVFVPVGRRGASVDFTLDDTQREIAGLSSVVLRKEPDPGRAWHALADSGLLSLALPPELGGDGLGVAEVALVLTEGGRAAAGVPALAALAAGVLPINHLGSAGQRAALLPGIASGEELVAAGPHATDAP